MKLANKLLLVLGGGPSEVNIACPAITPTLGAELLADADMEAVGVGSWPDYNAPTTKAKVTAPDPVHAGSQSLHVVGGAANKGAYQQENTTTGIWYMIDSYAYSAGADRAWVKSDIGEAHGIASPGDAAWTRVMEVIRETAGGVRGIYLTTPDANSTDIYFDDVCLNAITFSSARAGLGSIGRQTGTWTCTPTVEDGTQAGILLNYTDDDNFVMAIVDRQGTDNARLIKRIAGTYTAVTNGAITYGAAKVLKVVVDGTDYSLYYDDIQEGVTTAINDAGLGYGVHGFNTYDGNTVGTVTTDPTV